MKWITYKSSKWQNTGEQLKHDRVNFPIAHKKPEQVNREIDQCLKALKAACKKDKVTLYCEGVDENNMVVYRIREVPSFVARLHQQQLQF